MVDGQSPDSRGRVLRVEYDVSVKQAGFGPYCRLWVKWRVPDFNVTEWQSLSFYIRGLDSEIPGDGAGAQGETYTEFTTVVKVELKIAGWGWRVHYLTGVTSQWRQVVIPLVDFVDTTWPVPSANEFVLTFEQTRATALRGMLYVDAIAFEPRDE